MSFYDNFRACGELPHPDPLPEGEGEVRKMIFINIMNGVSCAELARNFALSIDEVREIFLLVVLKIKSYAMLRAIPDIVGLRLEEVEIARKHRCLLLEILPKLNLEILPKFNSFSVREFKG